MGVVIQFDFKKHAADREAAKRAKEKPVADLSTLYAPHTWPAGPAEEDIATVMTLDGTFRDSALYAAIKQDEDHYCVLQFAPHVTPETVADAKPLGRFTIPAAILKDHFTAMDRPADAKLGQNFARMAQQSDNQSPQPGQQAQLYNLAVTGVHLIVDRGLYSFGSDNTAELYHAGEAVVEYKGGSTARGPAHSMLTRILPLDRDARIALNHAPEHITAPRPNGPDGFHF